MHVMWIVISTCYGKVSLSGFLMPCAYVIVAIICVVVGYQIKVITAIVVQSSLSKSLQLFHEFYYNLQDGGHLVI